MTFKATLREFADFLKSTLEDELGTYTLNERFKTPAFTVGQPSEDITSIDGLECVLLAVPNMTTALEFGVKQPEIRETQYVYLFMHPPANRDALERAVQKLAGALPLAAQPVIINASETTPAQARLELSVTLEAER